VPAALPGPGGDPGSGGRRRGAPPARPRRGLPD